MYVQVLERRLQHQHHVLAVIIMYCFILFFPLKLKFFERINYLKRILFPYPTLLNPSQSDFWLPSFSEVTVSLFLNPVDNLLSVSFLIFFVNFWFHWSLILF